MPTTPSSVPVIAAMRRKENAPGMTRTCGTRIRNPVLYPPELRGRKVDYSIVGGENRSLFVKRLNKTCQRSTDRARQSSSPVRSGALNRKWVLSGQTRIAKMRPGQLPQVFAPQVLERFNTEQYPQLLIGPVCP
jgi:hypothetical protein